MGLSRALGVVGQILYAVCLTLMIPFAIIVIGLPVVLLVRLAMAIAGQF